MAAHHPKEGDTANACVVSELFEALSGKWTLPVLYQLHIRTEPIRFGELQRAVGRITQKELSKTLRMLESLELVQREQFPEIPPRVEYRVTELGASLRAPICGLADWLTEHRQHFHRKRAA